MISPFRYCFDDCCHQAKFGKYMENFSFKEKELIWNIREYCLTQLPELLPRIVDCVDYTDQRQSFQLSALLDRWPALTPERALQLLDYAYPDPAVRRFAVRCLRLAGDDAVRRYLIQLAQTLKHESYLHCDLVELLLEKALNSQHIGHHLFWELRAEMNSPSVGLQFGLILEAYLWAAPEHLRILQQQHSLLERCRATHAALGTGTMNFERAQNRFRACTNIHFSALQNFVSPLDPGTRCHGAKLERCRLMNSKMRPLMLAFDNADADLVSSMEFETPLSDVLLMYKRGDDLRQDRLTLQLLRVMDLLWKDAGFDFRLNIYRCVATDSGEGFIEVVQSAETLCSIQMAQADSYKATAAFRKGLLLAWLRTHNQSEEAMARAQWEFTRSCAGYSVAAYVLVGSGFLNFFT